MRQMLATACFAQFLLDGSNEARSEAADNLFQLVRRNDRNGPAWKMLAQISAAPAMRPPPASSCNVPSKPIQTTSRPGRCWKRGREG
jgi:hypothetical protein